MLYAVGPVQLGQPVCLQRNVHGSSQHVQRHRQEQDVQQRWSVMNAVLLRSS